MIKIKCKTNIKLMDLFRWQRLMVALGGIRMNFWYPQKAFSFCKLERSVRLRKLESNGPNFWFTQNPAGLQVKLV